MDVYSLLQKKVNMDLEHPLISSLHDAIVIQGDFKQAEAILLKADKQQAFSDYVRHATYTPIWQPVTALNNGKMLVEFSFCFVVTKRTQRHLSLL